MRRFVPVFLMTLSALDANQPAPPPDKTVVVSKTAAGGSFLGVAVAEVDAERAKSLNLREERGVEITRVEDDSPASRAGIKTGDVVIEYHGQRVEGMDQFMRLVRETPAGREVKLSVHRSGGLQTVMVKTEPRRSWVARNGDPFHIEIPRIEQPGFRLPDMPQTYMSWRNSVAGIEAESIDSQLAQYFGVKEGVLVRSVLKGSAAEKAGLKAGDVILKVDDRGITNPREISDALRAAQAKRSVPLTVMRERRETTLSLSLDDGGVNQASPRRPGRNKD